MQYKLHGVGHHFDESQAENLPELACNLWHIAAVWTGKVVSVAMLTQ